MQYEWDQGINFGADIWRSFYMAMKVKQINGMSTYNYFLKDVKVLLDSYLKQTL